MSDIKKYNFCQETIKMKEQIEVVFLGMGERLMKIRDEHLYEGAWASFDEYLKEMKMQPSVASRLITVYKKFILEYGIEPRRVALAGGWSNAYEIVGKSSTKAEALDWLEKFEYADSEKTVGAIKKELRTGVKRDECSHGETYTIKICRRCGEKIASFED